MAKRQYAVIGLGRFGSSVARTLYETGNDVLAIDKDPEVVQEISDYVTHSVVMDATDETALANLGIRNFDVAVVAIGGNIQSSILATLLIKEAGVNYIVAKGNNELHAKVLYRTGADKVILPEKDMGIRVAHNIVSSNILDYIELTSDYSIMEIEALEKWVGKTLRELDVRRKYGINIIGIKANEKINVSPSPDSKIAENDILIAIGEDKNLEKLEGELAKEKK